LVVKVPKKIQKLKQTKPILEPYKNKSPLKKENNSFKELGIVGVNDLVLET
jgi:hypothetical protein